MLPLSLYIHLPWCVQKCPYCDFNSHALRSSLPEEAYTMALLDELEQYADSLYGRQLDSIFFGGGTPSLFSGNAIETILKKVSTLFAIDEQTEITLEANPGTVDEKRFRDFYLAGVNRLSLGIQSLQANHLKKLGRIHDQLDAHRAIARAQSSGFRELNLDIMYGLEAQTIEEALDDVKQALSYGPSHFSWYQLTIEPNTAFYHTQPSLPCDDDLFEIQSLGQAWIQQQGFQQYEVSAYSLSGHHCRHNKNYWMYGDYLGIGAGAHSKLSDTTSKTIKRFMQVKHPHDYLNKEKRRQINYQSIDESTRLFEFMLNTLRLKDGFPISLFTERTFLPFSQMAVMVDKAILKGLMIKTPTMLKPTLLGERFLNDLTAMFLP